VRRFILHASLFSGGGVLWIADGRITNEAKAIGWLVGQAPLRFELGPGMEIILDEKPVLVAAGMDFEAGIAQGDGAVVLYGQNRWKYRDDLHRHLRSGVRGLISFGIAGGLAPDLKTGDVIIGNAVVTADRTIRTCVDWSKSLLDHLPHAHHLPVFGAEAPVLAVSDKETLWHTTGAVAVDMESGMVAEAADRYGLPYAVLRVVLDPADRSIPRSALVGARDDGTIDTAAVVKSLMRRPRDLKALFRLAGDSRKANRALLRSRQALGPLFGFRLLEADELTLNME
jgi:adenosylhomocysteine nucleosidase